MPAIVLQNAEKEMVGILLLAGNAGFEDGPDERHCIFTGGPEKEELFDDPLCDFVQTRKRSEFRARKTTHADAPALTIETPDDWSAIVELTTGTWRVVHPTDGEVAGTWEIAQQEE